MSEQITITALSPIAHGGFLDGIDLGNTIQFRRIPVVYDGKIVDVPTISGNSIRGAIRRILARELVDQYDLKEKMGKTFDKFYIALANGGNLDKSMDVKVDVEHLRQLRATIPMLSVLGASLYKYILPGMVSIGFATLRCSDLGTGKFPIADLVNDVGLVRHPDRTVADAKDLTPMPYTTETVITGSVFDARILFAPQTTYVERACIAHALKQISVLGAKSAAGFGRVQIDNIDDDKAYLDWLDEDNADALVDFAKELQ